MSVAKHEVLTVDEVAATLGVSPKSVRIWISQGKLDHFRAGRLLRVHSDALGRFMGRGEKENQAAA